MTPLKWNQNSIPSTDHYIQLYVRKEIANNLHNKVQAIFFVVDTTAFALGRRRRRRRLVWRMENVPNVNDGGPRGGERKRLYSKDSIRSSSNMTRHKWQQANNSLSFSLSLDHVVLPSISFSPLTLHTQVSLAYRNKGGGGGGGGDEHYCWFFCKRVHKTERANVDRAALGWGLLTPPTSHSLNHRHLNYYYCTTTYFDNEYH